MPDPGQGQRSMIYNEAVPPFQDTSICTALFAKPSHHVCISTLIIPLPHSSTSTRAAHPDGQSIVWVRGRGTYIVCMLASLVFFAQAHDHILCINELLQVQVASTITKARKLSIGVQECPVECTPSFSRSALANGTGPVILQTSSTV